MLRFAGLSLLAVAALAHAQTGGLQVRPADRELFAQQPREVVSATFTVFNGTGRDVNVEPRLVLPQGWRAMTPDLPFDLAHGATALRLISFVIPGTARAGEYAVTYEVRDRQVPSTSGAYSVRVQVLPSQAVQLMPVEAPDFAIAGEHYRATFLIRNTGNAPIAAEFDVRSGRRSEVEPRNGTIELEPGDSANVVIEVAAAAVRRRTEEILTLTVNVGGTQLGDSTSAVTQLVPRIDSEQAYHVLPTHLGMSFVARETDEGRTSGWQAAWSGGGAIDEAGSRQVQFRLRGPDVRDRGSLGPTDEYSLQYWDDTTSASVGDDVFTLSLLTEPGRYARGAQAGYQQESWGLSGYRARDRYSERSAEQTGLNAHYALTPKTRIDANFLDDSGMLPATVRSVRSRTSWPYGIATDVEVGASEGGGERGEAYAANLYGVTDTLSYYLISWHADPEYRGYLRDEEYLSAGFDHSGQGRWGWHGHYRWQSRNLQFDPERRAPRDSEAVLGVDRQLFSATRALLDFKRQTRSDQRVEPAEDVVSNAIRFGLGQSFSSASLYYSLERGRATDTITGRDFETAQHILSAYWRAGETSSYGLYALRDDRSFLGEPRSRQRTYGVNATFNPRPTTFFGLDAQHNRSADRRHLTFNASLLHELRNGHRVQMSARRIGGRLPQTDVLLTYSVPFDLPLYRRADVGAVQGRVYDAESGGGLRNIVLNLDGLTAVTDGRGEFEFPAVRAGSYQLSMDRGNVGVDKVPAGKLPLDVIVAAGDSQRVDVALANSVSVTVSVRLPEGTNMGGGVPNVLVSLSHEGQVYRRLTGADGRARVAGLPPGRWIASLDIATLPTGYELPIATLVLEIPAGGSSTAEFPLLPIKREIKMLSPLKIG